MNLECAILNVLDATPRAVTAGVILGFAPKFTGAEHTLAEIERALRRLEEKGHVKGNPNPDRGTVWMATDDGKLRIS